MSAHGHGEELLTEVRTDRLPQDPAPRLLARSSASERSPLVDLMPMSALAQRCHSEPTAHLEIELAPCLRGQTSMDDAIENLVVALIEDHPRRRSSAQGPHITGIVFYGFARLSCRARTGSDIRRTLAI